MYLQINGLRYTVSRRIVKPDTIKYLGVTPDPGEISGAIQMYRDDGFLFSEDNADSFERKKYSGTLLTLTNAAETAPTAPAPTIEQRITAIENAITKGLNL